MYFCKKEGRKQRSEKTLLHHLKYNDSFIKVYQDDVKRPDNKKGTYSVVKTKGGVGVVAIDSEDMLYLVGQYRYAPDVYSLEIPKGAFNSFDSTDSPLETAKRELKEETGLTSESWNELGLVHTLMGYSDDKVQLFLARDLSHGPISLESTEVIKVYSLPFCKIETVIREGLITNEKKIKITDATSIAAIFLARNFIRKIDNQVFQSK